MNNKLQQNKTQQEQRTENATKVVSKLDCSHSYKLSEEFSIFFWKLNMNAHMSNNCISGPLFRDVKIFTPTFTTEQTLTAALFARVPMWDQTR